MSHSLAYCKHPCLSNKIQQNPTKLHKGGNCTLTSRRNRQLRLESSANFEAYAEGTFKECVTWISKDISLTLSLHVGSICFGLNSPRESCYQGLSAFFTAAGSEWICQPKVKKSTFSLLFPILKTLGKHLFVSVCRCLCKGQNTDGRSSLLPLVLRFELGSLGLAAGVLIYSVILRAILFYILMTGQKV